MKQYNVTGMSCAACQARVEKAVSAVPGVVSCSVSLLTNSMGVEGDASPADVIRAVTDAGYGASEKGAAGSVSAPDDPLADRETPVLRRRLLTSLAFLIVLLFFSMGHSMLGLPLPAWFERNPVAIGLMELLLTGAVMVINKKFFVSGVRGAVHGAPNMDTLVALGASASFLWSVYALFLMTEVQTRSGVPAAAEMLDELYFESAAMILTLITVGKLLEAKSKGRTTDALKSLIKLAPKTASLVADGKEISVPVEQVKVGDVFAIRPGESFPVDAVVIEGSTAVDESALTGESIPVDKNPGDSVYTATVNRSGYVLCRASKVGEDTALSQIIKLVSDAAATKAPAAKLADKVSGIFVPTVLGISAVTLAVWLLLGKPFDFALARAVSVLVISCPCALGLATPVAIMVGSGVGAKHGVLYKTAEALEQTGKCAIIALDKTGTVTSGQPELTDILPAEGVTVEELLSAAYAIEAKSEHPLARAVVREAEKRALPCPTVTDFSAITGSGVSARLNGSVLLGGSSSFLSGRVGMDAKMRETVSRLADMGKTPLLFALDGRLLGILAAADSLKPESAEAVAQLEKMGVRVVMLTGDGERTAKAVAEKAGIRRIVSGVKPEGKAAVIAKLRELGPVTMVGDGINDAPALKSADIGMAIGAGTDVAIDAAEVVLMNSRLTDVPAAIRLSRAALTNIRENLFWAFFYNVIGIPLAAGCWIGLFGWQLDPMFGAAAMSLSSFCVVSNALRLNLFDMYSVKRGLRDCPVSDEMLDRLLNEINSEKENETMTKTMKIEGMMCPHCEARVKKTLESLDGVVSAEVSHTAGTAVVTLDKPVENDVLKNAVDAQGYPVLSIE